MRKVIPSLGSFVAGACFMLLLLSGTHTSTFAQGGALMPAAVTVVPPLRGINFSGANFTGVTQPLDGVECTNCIFNNVAFTYGGGAFSLVNFHHSGTTTLKLSGAAQNTFVLLSAFGFIRSPNDNAPAAPFVPPTEQSIKIENPNPIASRLITISTIVP
jgi:hypothetical protein